MDIQFIVPVVISFVISVLLCPVVIPFLRRLKFGQFIRDEGPKWHESKSGTPTMGGLIFLISVTVTCLFYVRSSHDIIPVLFVTVGFGIIGFLDDYIKVVMKRNLGLTAIQKLLGQIIVTVIFVYWLETFTDVGTNVLVPFTGGMYIDLGYLYVPFLFIVILGTVNGVNLTDGLDGLATSITVLVASFFTVIAIFTRAGLSPITGAVVGSLLGFLIFNVHPARVFMGDTGSLALGGFVASTAIVLRMPIFIVIVGFIYLIEELSVMLQVTYFKITKGKRLFKMAPLHHHFEMSGWPETRVVAVFAVITTFMCLLAFVAM